ncbi:hypothetical protein ACNKHS_09575 [Shigella flexneri]
MLLLVVIARMAKIMIQTAAIIDKPSSKKPMEGTIKRIGVPKGQVYNETRVAATPKTAEQLLKLVFYRRD